MHIEDYAFGAMRIDGTDYTGDVLIVRGEVRSPWWRAAGGHVFAPEDLAEVIAAAPEVVVFGTGYMGLVRVRDEAVQAFERAGTRVVVARTGKAVQEFNRLVSEGREVAAAFHLTC